MYKAHFTAGWMSVDAESNTLNGLVAKLNNIQDIRCLILQGLYMGFGTEEDCKELHRLEKFYNKFIDNTLEESDIRDFHYSLSLGDLDCTSFEITED